MSDLNNINFDTLDLNSKTYISSPETHKIWRKNVPYIYDLMYSQTLEWPSLSVQYFPDVNRDETREKTFQRLLLSTNTSKQDQDYIHIASIEYPDTFDEDLSEGCIGDMKLKIVQSIPVICEVNVVKYNPLAWHLLACRYDFEDVHIFDYTKHLANSTSSEPDIILKGHSKGGFGLCWNLNKKSELATAGEDSLICLYDIMKDERELKPITTLKNPSGNGLKNSTCKGFNKCLNVNIEKQDNNENKDNFYVVNKDRNDDIKKNKNATYNCINDICFNNFDSSMIASVGDNQFINIWDTRSKSLFHNIQQESEILSVDFSPLNSNLFATSYENKKIKIWDLRNMEVETKSLNFHSQEVYKIKWSPHYENILASASKDNFVCMWDISKTKVNDVDNTPAELIFLHGGHTNNVFDLCWNPAEPLEIASVDEDNTLQIWQIPERSVQR